jgi:DNA-binding beta-propeller fold protein YncE
VTDTLNDRVEIFDADGNFITMFGKNGDGPGSLSRPKGIAVDSDKHIWIADAVQQRVKVFNREGQLLIYFGQPGNWPGQFSALYDIAIDQKFNRVITSEQFPGRVQMFRYVTDAEADQLRTEQAQESKKSSAGETANVTGEKKVSAAPQ